jgi:hypothetical protein
MWRIPWLCPVWNCSSWTHGGGLLVTPFASLEELAGAQGGISLTDLVWRIPSWSGWMLWDFGRPFHPENNQLASICTLLDGLVLIMEETQPQQTTKRYDR